MATTTHITPGEVSEDPSVHRTFIVLDPPMEGRDVADLQRALHERLKARGLGDDVPTPTHGKFTQATWLAAVEAGYFLGLRSDTYLATDKDRGVTSEGAQKIIREPDQRTAEQRSRAKERADHLERGPRYYDELAQKYGITAGKGPHAALVFARQQIGTVEDPKGSNWGNKKIEAWIHLAGYKGPQPWCGCFANAACMAGGIPSGAGWIGYTPSIVAHAKNRIGGWSWHPAGQPGDLALFDTPGGDPAVHVGLVEKKLSATHYQTIEGNTAPPPGGPVGYGVFRRPDRSTQGNFHIIGFARPPWKKA